LLNGLQADDTVVVAVNGHGVHFRGDKVGYFCPLGTDLGDKKTLLPMDFFYKLLKKSKARQKLMIVQACQNDPFVNESFAADRFEFVAKSDEVPEGIAAIFSCMEGQKSYFDPDRKRGLFFNHVIRAWNGEYLAAGAQGLTLEDFFHQVRVKTKADALRFRGGVEQVPDVLREYKGEWVIAKPKAVKVITNGLGMKLAYVPAGTSLMGSPASEDGHCEREDPRHEVEIGRGFYMGIYAVTQEEYRAVVGASPSWFSASGKGKDNVAALDTRRLPVEMVSWEDAKVFCQKLSAREGKHYRLPTEAEWEYACRGGSDEYYVFHSGNPLSSKEANFDGNYPYTGASKGPYLARTTSVGSYAPNRFGLYDMHGNVWQWCQDWYDESYYVRSPRLDPVNTTEGFTRLVVMRGGSWSDDAWHCRSAARHGYQKNYRSREIGFRVVSNSVE
jgi:formylglycine-generating enzyme required for sulfatase activity